MQIFQNVRYNKGTFAFLFGISVFAICLTYGNVTYAADATAATMTNSQAYQTILFGFTASGISDLAKILTSFGNGFSDIAKIIATIMTAVGALMIAFGVQSGSTVFWSWIFGIGLAINFMPLMLQIYGTLVPGAGTTGVSAVPSTSVPSTYSFSVTSDFGSSFNLFSNFVTYYWSHIIVNAARHIEPYACRICIVLASIEASVQLGLKLVEGDKLKFLLGKVLSLSIYLFLILNWVNGLGLMGSLSKGFKGLGWAAADTSNHQYVCDAIITNCIAVVTAFYDVAKKADIALEIFLFVVLVFLAFLMILIAMETIVAQLEFDTMALLTIPLLAFGCISQLKFLSENSIKAMFNCAIKLMCIAFLGSIVGTTLTDYAQKMLELNKQDGHFWEQFGNVLTMIAIIVMLYMLVKKMPALVQGLLSGSPQLSGGDMMGSIKEVASKVGGAANKVGSMAGRVAGSMGKGSGGGKMQALKNAAGTLATAAATGGVGAAASMGGKMLAGAAAKAGKAGIKAAGKAAGRYAQRNVPGLKGFYDGKAAYKQDADTMNKKDAPNRGSNTSYTLPHKPFKFPTFQPDKPYRNPKK